MKKVQVEQTTQLKLTGISCFIKRKVTSFGTGAKVDCPKEFLGKEVYLVILENGTTKRS
jgi:putative transposon-encoded protein